MTFFEKLRSVFAKQGFVDKAKSNSMTAADWAAIREAYQTEYGVELSADQAAYNNEQQQAQQAQQRADQLEQENAAALTLINQALSEDEGASEPVSQEGHAEERNLQDQSLLQGVQTMVTAFQKMSKGMIPDRTPSVGGVTLSANGPGHTDQYFCGIEHDLFSMSHRYNQVARNPAYAMKVLPVEKTDGPKFHAALSEYSDHTEKPD